MSEFRAETVVIREFATTLSNLAVDVGVAKAYTTRWVKPAGATPGLVFPAFHGTAVSLSETIAGRLDTTHERLLTAALRFP